MTARRTIGVLGGMGPLATADLYRKIILATPARRDHLAEGAFVVQGFERNRFALHPDNQAPDDVLLGRLGVDTLHR